MPAKPHFDPSLFEFLRELSKNNRREWFQPNKARYEASVRDPALRFIADLAPLLRKLAPRFAADPRPVGGSLMRIYRDTRFSKDKTPYKTMVGMHFRHEACGEEIQGPGFYLRLETGEVMEGIGIWHPEPKALARIREAIAESPDAWRGAISGKKFTSRWTVEGESLARPPKGFPVDHPAIEELKRKDFIAGARFTEEEACSPRFLDRFAERLDSGLPMMKFLTKAVGLDW